LLYDFDDMISIFSSDFLLNFEKVTPFFIAKF
jgi:hypothetical protein